MVSVARTLSGSNKVYIGPLDNLTKNSTVKMNDPQNYDRLKLHDVLETFCPLLLKTMTWTNNENVLDYGCGPGSVGSQYLLPKILQTDSHLYGVDISREMISWAKEHHSHEKVSFQVADLMDVGGSQLLEKGLSNFDKIFCINVLHYIQNYRKAFGNFHKMLKPGGYLGLSFIRTASPFDLFRKFAKSEKWGKYMQGIEDFVPAFHSLENEKVLPHFRAELEKKGFGIVHIEQVEMKSTRNISDTVCFYKSLNPFVKDVPQHLLDELDMFIEQHERERFGLMENENTYDIVYEVVAAVVQKPEAEHET